MELDHLFVLVRPWRPAQSDAEAADELAASLEAAGFRQGSNRRHRGQGTENRCFWFDGFMFELLFVVSRDEAGTARSAPLGLLPRRDDPDASPFGIASRAVDARDGTVPYPHTLYRPLYLPPDVGIPIARDAPVGEPLWFHLPFAPSGAERRAASPEHPLHPNGASRLLGVTIEQPVVPGAVSAGIAARLGIGLRVGGAHRLTLRFDGGRRGRPTVLHERLPVVIDG